MPFSAGAWYGIGRIYEIQDQEAAAVNAYKSVVGKHPGTEFAMESLPVETAGLGVPVPVADGLPDLLERLEAELSLLLRKRFGLESVV